MEEKRNKWYALYTAPRAEKQVAERLRLRGVVHWLPLHRSPRAWSDRVKIVDIPLFPSYIFVCCEEKKLNELVQIAGICTYIRQGNVPSVVREEEIEAIRSFLVLAEEKPLCMGEEVEIQCGPFKHITGKIERIDKSHVMIRLEQLGLMACVRMDAVAHSDRIR